jgi:hypothetical protein
MDYQVGGVGMIKLFVILVVVIALLLLVAKMVRKKGVVERSLPDVAGHDLSSQPSSIKANLKQCPTCHSTFTDETLRFCLIDGAALEDTAGATTNYDPAATVKLNHRGASGIAPTIEYHSGMRDDKDKV